MSKTVLNAEKKIHNIAGCTGARFQAGIEDASCRVNIFTATVQDFGMACRSNDIAEVANYTEPAPSHGVVHHQYHIRRVYLGLP